MISTTTSLYAPPSQWIRYDKNAILEHLVEAKTAAGILRRLPYLPQWIEKVRQEQLRLEAAGTSRIEGAEFTPQEEREALTPESASHTNLTYSQRQLRAADTVYRWMSAQPTDRPVNSQFILEVHRHVVTGCEDDHCEPGALRGHGRNVTFGSPRCRGVDGGDCCTEAFDDLCTAIRNEFSAHDPLVQAMATHYHIGAMHPFDDGNGLTARAVEAFMLRRAGVNDHIMVSISNYYYNHKDEYLGALFESRQQRHDLTPFLQFALLAVTDRCNAVAEEILLHHKRSLFREFAGALFGQLRSPRRRILAERQIELLDLLLHNSSVDMRDFIAHAMPYYRNLKHQERALARDLIALINLGAVTFSDYQILVNLEWPYQLSQSELLARYEKMPSSISVNHPAIPSLSRLLRHR